MVARAGLTRGQRACFWVSLTSGPSVPSTSLRSFLQSVKVSDVVVEIAQIVGLGWLELSESKADLCEIMGWFDSKWAEGSLG